MTGTGRTEVVASRPIPGGEVVVTVDLPDGTQIVHEGTTAMVLVDKGDRFETAVCGYTSPAALVDLLDASISTVQHTAGENGMLEQVLGITMDRAMEIVNEELHGQVDDEDPGFGCSDCDLDPCTCMFRTNHCPSEE